jgi:glycosyltransferase involved in cell wall biosynthesis
VAGLRPAAAAMNLPRHPLVSIIVPSFNQGHFLRETLDSILGQDYRPLEVLVMDGGSKDQTVPILRELAARHSELQWVSEPDHGVADAVNKGLARARGPIAGIQSSDDLYRPGAIAEAVAVLEREPDVGLVCADMDIVDEHGRFRLLAPARARFTPERFLSRATLIHQSSTFFRTALAREAGGYDARYYCADTALWLKMLFRTRMLRVDRVWSAWRTHPGQRDKERRKMWESWGRMIDECRELAGAPLSWRLAARAGRRLVALDYNPRGSRWFATAQAWLAVLTWPPAWHGVPFKHVLFPGLGRIRRLAAARRPPAVAPQRLRPGAHRSARPALRGRQPRHEPAAAARRRRGAARRSSAAARAARALCALCAADGADDVGAGIPRARSRPHALSR